MTAGLVAGRRVAVVGLGYVGLPLAVAFGRKGRVGLDTREVLAAAGTKWNFLRFVPGLVGGHCIGVDPYYLTHKAEALGHHPEVILAGRRINDAMGQYVAEQAVKTLIRAGKGVRDAPLTVATLARWCRGTPVLIDVKGRFPRAAAEAAGVAYFAL